MTDLAMVVLLLVGGKEQRQERAVVGAVGVGLWQRRGSDYEMRRCTRVLLAMLRRWVRMDRCVERAVGLQRVAVVTSEESERDPRRCGGRYVDEEVVSA